jgi:integrase
VVEQLKIEEQAPAYRRNVVRIITETGLRGSKELASMKKEQVDLANKVVFITDSKTPTGVADVPLTDMALEAFRSQIEVAGLASRYFRATETRPGTRPNSRRSGDASTSRHSLFRLYDLRSTYATRLSAGGADEWVTQMLRQTDAQVFKKYSQMKLQMKREALAKLNRKASETGSHSDTEELA